ncbi:MAG: outer membrane protein assembly factor BamA [Caulobacteraceae bacterium]
MQIRPRGIFTRSKVEQDVQRIIELYRRSGRISATVTPKIVQLPQKRVDLIFEIDEGPKSGILRVNFIGNKAFGDGALRDVIVTRESHWYKFFQSNDNYDPDRIEYDREQLRKFYRNHGYYDFRIVSAVAELAPDKNGFAVTFTIDEGPKYHFGKLKVVTELKRLNGALLQELLPIREGQLYQDDRIEKATDSLTFAAGANGFAFVDIRPEYVAHPETKTVDVTFNVKEGPRVYIERIDIVGNTQTLDRVIRREMQVAEGDAYNRVLVDRSKTRIRGLGFFKDVDIEQLPGTAPDKTILRVKVTEQPTGQLTFSLGYSSVEKLVGNVGISQSNFRGRGQTVNFQVELGYYQKSVQLSFTEPRFMGHNMSAGFDIYTQDYNFSDQASFDTATTGINLKTGFPINQYASIGLRYAIHTDKVTIPDYIVDPTTGKCALGYSQSLCEEVGSSLTSSVGYTVRWDRRNDPLSPTRGFYIDFGQDFAGFGGDVKYIRSSTDGAWYYGITPAWVFSLQESAGYITGWGGDAVRINDRFFKGGDTFRGFEIAGIGPRDTTVVDSTGTRWATRSAARCSPSARPS